MGSNQGEQAVTAEESLQRLRAVLERARASVVVEKRNLLRIAALHIAGITPKDVAQEASIRWLLEPVDFCIQVFNLVHVGRDTSMDTQIQPIDDSGKWQAIKHFHEPLIGLKVVLLDALFSESKVFCHRSGLVVASEEDYFGRLV